MDEDRKIWKLSILMPAYNEEDTIAEIVERIDRVNLSKICVEKELIIIDDCSKDSTAEIVKRLKAKYSYVRFIQHDKNTGKGGAIKTAIKAATGDIMIVQDADLEYDPQDYIRCIKPILAGDAEVVYGSRNLEKRNKMHSSTCFYIGGIGITWIFNILFLTRLTDEPTCYKTFRSDVIRKIKIDCDKFDWEPEVTAKIVKRRIRIHEVPIRYYPRSSEEGKKIRWQDGVYAVLAMIKYRFIG